MPPDCDALDGPVVEGAAEALEQNDVDLARCFVPEWADAEVTAAFGKAVAARALGPEAKDVADRWFFETVVRMHRAGEGAPYTGLKPAGLDHGPVIPVAEAAIASGSAEELIGMLSEVVREEVGRRFDHVMQLKAHSGEGLTNLREYTSAMLGLQVYANGLYSKARSDPHEQHGEYERHED